jgi:hypothetical protein
VLEALVKAAVLGAFDKKAGKVSANAASKVLSPEEAQLKQDILSSRATTARERRIGESAAAGMEDLMMEREGFGQVPLLAANRSKVANILAPEEDEFNLGSRLFQLPSQLKDGGMITEGKFQPQD